MTLVKLSISAAYKLMQKKLLTYKPDKEYKLSLGIWRHYENLYNQQHKSETDYPSWVKKREFKQLKRLLHIKESIKFHILIYCDDSYVIDEILKTVKSVQEQTYPLWEISLILKCPLPEDKRKLEEIRNKLDLTSLSLIILKKEPRLTVSTILEQTNASYFLNLEPNTLLSPHGLSIYSRFLVENKQADIYYSDHDFIDENGQRHSPQLKPNWNPDLLLSTNFIGNGILIKRSYLSTYKNTILDQNGIWTYKLLLKKVFENSPPQHIAQVLTHQSRPRTISEYQLTTLKTHLNQYNVRVTETSKCGVYRTSWPVCKVDPPLVSIIIPTRDEVTVLKRAIESLISKTTYINYEIIIVDNQSKHEETKNYLNSISQTSNITVLRYNKAFNYSAINNFAARHAQGHFINLLNNDVEIISPNWLTEMVSHASREDIGCVGAKLIYPDGRIQHAGVIVGLSGCAGHSHKFYGRNEAGYMNRLICTQNYSAVTGACLLLRKEIFFKVGGLNEKELSVAFNDVDLCLKVQKIGYRNIWTPWAELYHHESLTRGQDNTKKKRKRLTKEINYMKTTWKTTNTLDPYYHQNLTRLREDFSLGL
jgi:GT2 family glycosyltransferase